MTAVTGAKRHQVNPYAEPPPESDDFDEYFSAIGALNPKSKPGRF